MAVEVLPGCSKGEGVIGAAPDFVCFGVVLSVILPPAKRTDVVATSCRQRWVATAGAREVEIGYAGGARNDEASEVLVEPLPAIAERTHRRLPGRLTAYEFS